MKKVSIIISAMFAISTFIANAQQSKDSTNQYAVIEHGNTNEIKTLFGSNHSNGFYLSYDLGFTTSDKKQTIENGGRIAWIIDHSMAFGFFGNGFISSNEFNRTINGKKSNVSLAGGYGGLLFEPIVLPKQPIHVSFPIELGVGGAGFVPSSSNRNNSDYNFNNQSYDAFMVLKPGVEMELNMLKFFRLALGVQYRFVYGVKLDGIGKNDLNGISGRIAFKFGKF